MSALHFFFLVRTMELPFDYKIKSSEKVYTYILQKRAWARVHLANEDQLPTVLNAANESAGFGDK